MYNKLPHNSLFYWKREANRYYNYLAVDRSQKSTFLELKSPVSHLKTANVVCWKTSSGPGRGQRSDLQATFELL